MKKWIFCLVSVLILGMSGIVSAASDSGENELSNLVFPKVGAVFFMNGGLRGDERVEEQVREAVHKKFTALQNINYLNDGLMKAKFQEYSFRKNIQDGNDLYPYGEATLEQLVDFGKENRLHQLIVVECYLRNVGEKQSDPKPGVEIKSEFTSKTEIIVKVINPNQGIVIEEFSFDGDGKSNIAIRSYWSAFSKSVKKLRSEWKPSFK
jgi:hypothetical protein